MNIKNIKALKDNEVYPKWFLEQKHDNYIVEDMEVKDRCMPYNFYPIPKVEDLACMLTAYVSEGKTVNITAEFSPLGTMFYGVKVLVFGAQDSYSVETSSPFLDDALAEALIQAKKYSDDKKEMMKEMNKMPDEKCPEYEGSHYCLFNDEKNEGKCTFPDELHWCHPKG